MTNRQVLVIRNLPSELSNSDKEDLLRHFGAQSVKILPSKKKKSIAFAKFDTEAKTRNVLFRLHQLEVLGNRLVVEYAKENVSISDPRIDKNSPEKEDPRQAYFKEFKMKLNSWNTSVDFHQPPPPHLKYAYPRANVATINNIAHALASVPKFYTQVLHLMNKMNLPPPFSNIPDPPEIKIHHSNDETVEIPEPAEETTAPPEPLPEENGESEESEMESDPEEYQLNENNIPIKRTLPQKGAKVKRPKFIKPPVITPNTKATRPSTNDVFDKVDLDSSQKKIELIVNTDCVENITQTRDDSQDEVGSFGKINRIKPKSENKTETQIEVCDDTNQFISEKELLSNRISEKEYDHFPIFKNYHAGAPNCRLYIKNLAKNVTVEDLNFIFRRYIDVNDSESSNMFDIRLMQEGRMKGQAFVTLTNVDQAQKALKETNGYVLKDKPMVVVFARSAKPK